MSILKDVSNKVKRSIIKTVEIFCGSEMIENSNYVWPKGGQVVDNQLKLKDHLFFDLNGNEMFMEDNNTTPEVKIFEQNGELAYSKYNPVSHVWEEYELITPSIAEEPREFPIEESDDHIIVNNNEMSVVLDNTELYNFSESSLNMIDKPITNVHYPPVNDGDASNKLYVDRSMPTGSIIVWYFNSIPTGWLLCNGESVDPVLYPELHSLTATTPNLEGYFLRGLDPTGTVDIDGGGVRTLGSVQTDQLVSHDHEYSYVENEDTCNNNILAGSAMVAAATVEGNTQNTGGTETRPKNIAVNYIIKAM